MKRVQLEVDGKKIEVLAERIQGKIWFHYEGKTRVFETSVSGRKAGARGKSTHPGKIFSPMPGKIVKVSAKGGQIVGSGETLIVMEAMKMEYSLQADIDGCVSQVKCKVGDQVGLGSLLVEITPEL